MSGITVGNRYYDETEVSKIVKHRFNLFGNIHEFFIDGFNIETQELFVTDDWMINDIPKAKNLKQISKYLKGTWGDEFKCRIGTDRGWLIIFRQEEYISKNFYQTSPYYVACLYRCVKKPIKFYDNKIKNRRGKKWFDDLCKHFNINATFCKYKYIDVDIDLFSEPNGIIINQT